MRKIRQAEQAAVQVARRLGQRVTFHGVDLNHERFHKAEIGLVWDPELVDCTLHEADASSWLFRQPPNSLDFVLLDDDYTPNYVEDEITAATRAVKAGGIVLCHDVHSVYQLYRQVHKAGGVCVPTVPAHAVGAGLGIIEVK